MCVLLSSFCLDVMCCALFVQPFVSHVSICTDLVSLEILLGSPLLYPPTGFPCHAKSLADRNGRQWIISNLGDFFLLEKIEIIPFVYPFTLRKSNIVDDPAGWRFSTMTKI